MLYAHLELNLSKKTPVFRGYVKGGMSILYDKLRNLRCPAFLLPLPSRPFCFFVASEGEYYLHFHRVCCIAHRLLISAKL